MLPRINPINPVKIAAPFDHQDWVFELKHDGFRAVAYIEDGNCELVSRKQIVYKSFPGLTSAIAGLRVKDAILDGEIVCVEQDGKSMFLDLMHRKRQDAAFYVFDILWLNGEDLRGLELMERKRVLRKIIPGHDRVLYADHIESRGVEFFRVICERDCEGIVAKHKLGTYTARPATWLKVLNPAYTQKRGRREMFDAFRGRAATAPSFTTES